MLKRVSTLLMLATIAGCAGESFKPKAVITDVEPNFIAIGRTKQVEIHGDFTKWKDSSIAVGDISFGADVSVDAVTVGNEGFLLVTITASPTAAAGPRDIEVDGEDLVGAFFVNPAFEILNSTIVQGDFAMLDIVGYDTDWLEGRTEVTIDSGVHSEGDDYLGMTFTTVIAPNFVQAFVQADAFATAGGRAVTVSGLTRTDSVPNALTIQAAEWSQLVPGNNVLNIAQGGGIAAKIRIPAGVAPSVQQLIASAGTSDPIGFILDPDLGMAVPAGFVGDEFLWGSDTEFRLHNLSTGKDLYILFWDAFWLDDAYFGDVGTTGEPLSANLQYASHTPAALTLATPLADQTIASAGGLATYTATATNRWNLVTVDVTTPDAGATIDGLLDAAREGITQGVLADEPADATGNGGDETLTYLAGGGLDAIVIFEAFGSGTQNGATSEHDVVFTEAAPAGMLFAANDIALDIPEEGQVESDIVVTGATTAITAVHVMVDLDHTWRGDLILTLESPMGEMVVLYNGVGSDGRDGLIEAFPDTMQEFGDLTVYATDDANGTWTLHVQDDAAPDAGVVRGWAISFEGV